MLKYVVIHESGMGSSCVVSVLYDTEEEADQERDRLIDSGRGGTQDYPMPDGEEYWDSVGYDYLDVESIEVDPTMEWEQLWGSVGYKYLTLEEIAENKKEDYRELVTTATAACFTLAGVLGHEALRLKKEYTISPYDYEYFKKLGSSSAVVAEFDRLVETSDIQLDECQKNMVENFHSRCS